MQIKTFFRHGIRLLVAVLVFMVMAPSAVIAADNWSYPTSKPSNPFGGGNGNINDPYIISTAQHLANLAYMVTHEDKDYDGKYFLQTRDIVLNDDVIEGATKEANGSIRYDRNKDYFDKLKWWQPIGAYGYVWNSSFEGIYDGGGHSVSGVCCRKPLEKIKSKHFAGLFGVCDEARISNLTIKDSFFSIYGTNKEFGLGTLVGSCDDTSISNCHAYDCVISGDGDEIAEDWRIGGLVGMADGNFTAKNCSYNGIVDAYCFRQGVKNALVYNCIGGLIGSKGYGDTFSHTFSLEDCSTKGKLLYHELKTYGYEGAHIYVSGLVGYATNLTTKSDTKHILRCANRMDISVCGDATALSSCIHYNAAGLACDEVNCSESINFGDISIGGSNYMTWSARLTGSIRLCGIAYSGKIDNCFSYGNLSIAPMSTSIDNTWALGSVVSIGEWTYGEGTVNNCYGYNTITYKFDEGAPKIHIASGGDVKVSDAKYHITVNGEKQQDGIANESDFKSEDYVRRLNQAAGASKYGLEKADGKRYNGCLSLTSLGALLNGLNGDGTADNPYVISNANNLRTMADMLSTGGDFTNSIFRLTADIDMTEQPAIESLDSDEHPFAGIFDGNGHYIRGLRTATGYLFRNVTGTVKNLAIDGITSLDDHFFAGIAYKMSGKISNCYVIANPGITLDNMSSNAYVSGICHSLLNGASISDCYFTGKVSIAKAEGVGTTSETVSVGGIATTAQTGASIERCYAVVEYDADKTITSSNLVLGGIVAGESVPTLTGDYYHIEYATSSQRPTTTRAYEGTTAKGVYAITADDLGSAWTKGRYYPVLLSAYHYDCTDSNGNAVALDPAGYAPADNEILTLVPTDEQADDNKMWQLPNLSVYSAYLDTEILTNFNIVPDTKDKHCPLRYKPTKEGVSVKGLATYTLTLDKNYVNWRALCLPGAVNLSSLPDGSKLYVGGKLQKRDNGDRTMNIVEVESVPAGVPFILRYDNTGKDDETLVITMTGTLAMTPQTADPSSSLVGTFEYLDNANLGDSQYYYSSVDDNKMYDINDVYCFRAYVVNDNKAAINLTDYLLLDEQSNNTDEVIAANADKTLNIKLRRSIRTGSWNTVCLPFDVSGDEITSALGSGTRVEELSGVSYDATTNAVVMTFGTATSMEAGKSYLVYPENAATIFDLSQRTIVGTPTPSESSNVSLGNDTYADISMVGSYGKAYLASTDKENQYFIQQDKFYRATNANPVIMSGFRCYFTVTSTTSTTVQALNAARIVHSDGTVTDIKLIDTGLGTDGTRIYDLQGIRHGEMQRGVNIVGGKKIMK